MTIKNLNQNEKVDVEISRMKVCPLCHRKMVYKSFKDVDKYYCEKCTYEIIISVNK